LRGEGRSLYVKIYNDGYPGDRPDLGALIEGDRQADGAGIAAVGQKTGPPVKPRIPDAPRQNFQRLGHVGASDEMAEAVMQTGAEVEMRLALGGDVETRCEVSRIGAGRFGEEVDGGAPLQIEVAIDEILVRLARHPGHCRTDAHHLLDRIPREIRPIGEQ